PSVTATSFAQRVVARTGGGHTPTLENNYAIETLLPVAQSDSSTGPDTLNGETRTEAEAADVSPWSDGLGWDIEDVGPCGAEGARPILQSVPEDVEAGPTEPETPDLAPDDDGAYLRAEAADFAEAADGPEESYRLTGDLDVSGETLAQLGVS